MQSETMRGSEDGSVEETLSAAQSRPCARNRGCRGGRGRDRGRLTDGRLYYRSTPARTSASRCLRLRRTGGGRPCPGPWCRSGLLFSVYHRCRLSFVRHRDEPAVCPSPRLLDGPWACRAIFELGCVCGRLDSSSELRYLLYESGERERRGIIRRRK